MIGRSGAIGADGREINRLADALLVAASEYVTGEELPPATILSAFGVALGRTVGGIARDSRESLLPLLDYVMRHVRRTAHLEFARRAWPLQ